MKRPLTLLTLPATVLVVAACGGNGHTHPNAGIANPPAAAGTSTTATTAPTPATRPAPVHAVTIEANPSGQLRYAPSALSTTAGRVAIEFTNDAPLGHDLVLLDAPTYSPTAKVLGQTPIFQGGTKSFMASLTAGKYYFFCSVPGHRQAGMFGTLTVG